MRSIDVGGYSRVAVSSFGGPAHRIVGEHMRTGGGGGREGLMTAIPLAVIIGYLTFVAGGPKQAMKAMEKRLRTTVEWHRPRLVGSRVKVQ